MSPDPDALSHIHEPVLVAEVLAHLAPAMGAASDGLIVDGTLGLAGHALVMLAQWPTARLLGLDRDPAALRMARQRLECVGARAQVAHASYAELSGVLSEGGLPAPRAMLLDLGLSSLQLDDPQRGFSFRDEAGTPDMRFDAESDGPTALDLVNSSDERTLVAWLKELGEEPRARAVARALVRSRPFETVGDLVHTVRRHALRGRRHDPATRTFQALRIAVNDELGHLARGLGVAIDALADGGRLLVICFHSGEERLVKDAFREAARAGKGQIITRKPVRATEEEVRRNPRARPARLRVFETGARSPMRD